MTIGEKRNRLLEMADGEYTAFVDDDDEVSNTYIDLILAAIKSNRPDVIGMIGEVRMTLKSGRVHRRVRFYHTIRNSTYFDSPRGFERPPNHLNPMKREIALRHRCDEKNFGDDTDWAMDIVKAGDLKTEVFIDKPIYFYNFNPNKRY